MSVGVLLSFCSLAVSIEKGGRRRIVNVGTTPCRRELSAPKTHMPFDVDVCAYCYVLLLLLCICIAFGLKQVLYTVVEL